MRHCFFSTYGKNDLMVTDVELPAEERIFQLVRHLGLEQAHFAAREFLEFDGLVRNHREIVASLTLVLPPRTLDPETLRPLATRLLCFYGGKGPNAAIVRQSLATLPFAATFPLDDYLDVNWADVIADRTDFIGDAMLEFLAHMDLQAALRTASLAPGDGEVAGIRYRILGSGPPLVLLPLVLSPSQWEPLLPRLSERYCTIVPGGPELGGVRQLEARGGSPAHRRVLERFLAEGEAPIVFALGSSAVWIAGDFWDKAAAAARELGRRAILVTGPVTPAGLPGGVRAFPYLPYSSAFPRAAAVVHQAGIGTLAQALRAGRPQLIVPVAFDQPDNAQRAAALGLARALPFRKVTAGRLASELAALLDRSSYASEARAVAAALTGVDGAGCAAEELIACAQPPAARSRSDTAPRSMT